MGAPEPRPNAPRCSICGLSALRRVNGQKWRRGACGCLDSCHDCGSAPPRRRLRRRHALATAKRPGWQLTVSKPGAMLQPGSCRLGRGARQIAAERPSDRCRTDWRRSGATARGFADVDVEPSRAQRWIEWGHRLVWRTDLWLSVATRPDRDLQTLCEEIAEWRSSVTEILPVFGDEPGVAPTGEQAIELQVLSDRLRTFVNRYGKE